MDALKPCPFCGGKMMFRKALWPSDGDCDAVIHRVGVGCPMEQFSNGTADGQIIAAWNHRPETDRLVEALREAREALHRHYVDWDGEPEDVVPLQEARSKIDALLSSLKGTDNG